MMVGTTPMRSILCVLVAFFFSPTGSFFFFFTLNQSSQHFCLLQ